MSEKFHAKIIKFNRKLNISRVTRRICPKILFSVSSFSECEQIIYNYSIFVWHILMHQTSSKLHSFSVQRTHRIVSKHMHSSRLHASIVSVCVHISMCDCDDSHIFFLVSKNSLDFQVTFVQ